MAWWGALMLSGGGIAEYRRLRCHRAATSAVHGVIRATWRVHPERKLKHLDPTEPN